ncbi:MAG: hypothetical protein EA392_02470 [Cryomorphaceae bacterium]|nr:MAG: hypothetical protein EA392_02470 [Cryomorphaceae bacterium]
MKGLPAGEERLKQFQQKAREIKDLSAIAATWDQYIPEDNYVGMEDMPQQHHELKRMFIFGAAASSFCCFDEQKEELRKHALSPPTGYEVFAAKYDELISEFPGADQSTTKFESRGNDIESCLEEEWDMVKTKYNPNVAIRHLNIQFYLQKLFLTISSEVHQKFRRKNLYRLLLSKLEAVTFENPQERISLVTFNYDTILDHFVTEANGVPLNSMESYVDYRNNNLLLFKPHGSCNWGWRIPREYSEQLNGASFAQYLWEEKVEPWKLYFEILGDIDDMIDINSWGPEQFNDEFHRGRYTIAKSKLEVIPKGRETDFFPALLIPYRDKDEVLMPYEHVETLKHAIDRIEELYLIGWKGNERLFNKKLERARNLKRLIIVNPEAKEVEKRIVNCLPKGVKPEIIHVHDFEEFVLNRMDELLKIERN